LREVGRFRSANGINFSLGREHCTHRLQPRRADHGAGKNLQTIGPGFEGSKDAVSTPGHEAKPSPFQHLQWPLNGCISSAADNLFQHIDERLIGPSVRG
jgi:hypothetical protein